MQEIISKRLQINPHWIMQIAGFIVLIVITIIYGHVIIHAANNLFSTDFFKFYQSTQFYFEGQSIYDKIIMPLNPVDAAFFQQKILILNSDLNPPFFTLILLPMAWLTYYQALLLWSSISAIATVAGILMVLTTYPALWHNRLLRLWVFIGFLVYFPTFANIRFGQVSSILLLLTAAAWLACRKQQVRRAGVLLGLALSIKLFYGIFLIFFAVRKQWRLLCYLIITYLTCALTALWFFGFRTYESYFAALRHINWIGTTWNASILGFLIRLFGGNNEGNLAVFNHPGITQPLYWIISLSLAAYLITTSWRDNKLPVINYSKLKIDGLDYFDWGFSLAIVVMLFVTPLAWLYYFPLLIIPFVTILRITAKVPTVNFNLILLSLIILLSGMPCNYERPKAITNAAMALSWASYYFYALVILVILMIFLRKQLLKIKMQNVVSAQYSLLSPVVQTILFMVAALPSLLSFVIAVLP